MARAPVSLEILARLDHPVLGTLDADAFIPILERAGQGAPLFDDKGEPTQVIENVKRYLSELQQMDVITRDFCKYMAEHNMFTPLNMRVRDTDRVKNITGCYVINEERLNNLSDEDQDDMMRTLNKLHGLLDTK